MVGKKMRSLTQAQRHLLEGWLNDTKNNGFSSSADITAAAASSALNFDVSPCSIITHRKILRPDKTERNSPQTIKKRIIIIEKKIEDLEELLNIVLKKTGS